jgi:hypothetical protein
MEMLSGFERIASIHQKAVTKWRVDRTAGTHPVSDGFKPELAGWLLIWCPCKVL